MVEMTTDRSLAARLAIDAVQEHGPMLLATARLLTLSEAEAQDLVQATLEIALRRLDTLRDPTPSAAGCCASRPARRSGSAGASVSSSASTANGMTARIPVPTLDCGPTRPTSGQRSPSFRRAPGLRWCSTTWWECRCATRPRHWA